MALQNMQLQTVNKGYLFYIVYNISLCIRDCFVTHDKPLPWHSYGLPTLYPDGKNLCNGGLPIWTILRTEQRQDRMYCYYYYIIKKNYVIKSRFRRLCN